ncbi:sensor histidine kinase [Streptomyces sp. MUM 178J]|uniref:sensor histidine kinase n=1 Tax=Streptomyces sp. MUM 178J TaxID=2791991 RepID=UPI001F04C503|nr:histidine kinase [Streptomyces sp. MUM 178J]WRQ78818.1 histidine kinase [Streptomyces sp. MUM 178J]
MRHRLAAAAARHGVSALCGALAALLGRRARLRWVHLVLGGALLMPYWLLAAVFVGPLSGAEGFLDSSVALQFGAYAAALPLVAVTALAPVARPLSVALARPLCGVPPERFVDGAAGLARTRAARLRTSAWCTLHFGVGALISGASLALPPFAVSVMIAPFSGSVRDWLGAPGFLAQPAVRVLAPLAGVAMLLALAAWSAAAGALLARVAPRLLGPTPEDRLASAERRAAELAERNRLARELHDSVGHALSAVTLQAGAARRVLGSDAPGDVEFVREALAAIEDTARRTVGELDCVLGLLRHGEDGGADPAGDLTGPGLDAVDGLLARSGVRVSLTSGGDPAAVPPAVSREAYRIVQEGLSNVLRHAGGPAEAAPAALSVLVGDEKLVITMENPLPGRPGPVRPGGGRGLRGVAERASLLGGHAEAGPRQGVWRLSAMLPLRRPLRSPLRSPLGSPLEGHER